MAEVPTHQRVRIICKDNYKYEVAPADDHEGNAMTAETAITNAGTLHHHLHHRGGGHLAPHHPHHPHHVQAAAAAAAHHHAHHGMGAVGGGGPQGLHPHFHRSIDELALEEKPKWDWAGENYINVDRFFLVAMPCLFLIFNVVYWFSYGSHFMFNSIDDDEVTITELD